MGVKGSGMAVNFRVEAAGLQVCFGFVGLYGLFRVSGLYGFRVEGFRCCRLQGL